MGLELEPDLMKVGVLVPEPELELELELAQPKEQVLRMELVLLEACYLMPVRFLQTGCFGPKQSMRIPNQQVRPCLT